MMKLFYITNNPEVAIIAQNAGVDRIFVDLETLGKNMRQGGMDTVQSRHSISDIKRIKDVLTTSELLVRSNPIHIESRKEIDEIIANGADYIMLPYFKTVEEVCKFIDYVDGRCKTIPLLETKEAVNIIDDILELDGIDEIYVGLNDLHLSYGMKFMFELLANGTVDMLAEKFRTKQIPFGFGGVAKMDGGAIPGKAIVYEHYRLGSSRVILSRSFCNTEITSNLKDIENIFKEGIGDIRKVESNVFDSFQDLDENHNNVVNMVNQIIMV